MIIIPIPSPILIPITIIGRFGAILIRDGDTALIIGAKTSLFQKEVQTSKEERATVNLRVV